MKLLFTTPAMRFGGAERVISVLSNQWAALGHEVHIVITGEDGSCVYPLADAVTVSCLGGVSQHTKLPHLALIRRLRTSIKAAAPDVVISFMNDICAYTAAAMVGLPIPLIYSERNDPNKVNQGRKDRLFRKIVERRAHGIVFQTEGAKACYSPAVQRKSRVILNPLDTRKLPEYVPDGESREIVTVGRLSEQKNHRLLISAFAELAPAFPDYCLKIYGSGPLEDALREQIRGLHLQERVLLMGNSAHVLQDIRSSALFVFSSDFEGLPNALMEAMAMGLPCISTDCSPGGARMLIHSGENGLLVPCGDVSALSGAMVYMLRHRREALAMGSKAKALKNQIQAETIAVQWLEYIEQINQSAQEKR